MRLFEIDEASNEVKVNVAWIKLIPEFSVLFSNRVKMRTGWDRDTIGVKRLSYIYFMLDFTSCIADWDEDKRQEEALNYTGLSKADVEIPIMKEALIKYELLQYEMCRPLKTYRSALRGLEAMDKYLATVNFSKTDKQGKLLYTPNQFTTNIAVINKAYEELAKLKKKIEEELSQVSSIRGAATMGDREMKYFGKAETSSISEWDESREEIKDNTDYVDLASLIHNLR